MFKLGRSRAVASALNASKVCPNYYCLLNKSLVMRLTYKLLLTLLLDSSSLLPPPLDSLAFNNDEL
jgi:hypothetical protein